MDKSIVVNNEVNEFVLPTYNLTISRAWRGHANVIFLELGELKENKGVYTLWVETSFWKLVESDVVFDGNEEPYETIDAELSKLVGQKIAEFSYSPETKTFEASFSGGKKLVAKINDSNSFVTVKLNKDKTYLNFEYDGTATFDFGGHKKSSGA